MNAYNVQLIVFNNYSNTVRAVKQVILGLFAYSTEQKERTTWKEKAAHHGLKIQTPYK